MRLVRDTWLVFARLVHLTLRMPVWIVMAIVQPIVWLILFGGLFRSVVALPGFGGASYVQYLAPGVAIMTALFGASHSGLSLLGEIDRGVLDRFLVTPVSRGALMAGRVSHAALQVLFQSGLLLAVAAWRGAAARGGFEGWLIVCVAAAFLGGAVAAISNALALLTQRQEIVIAIMNFVLLPLPFLSSMLISPDLMPGPIAAVARFNPVDWAVRAARAGFEGRPLAEVAPPLALSWAFATLMIGLATLAFRRYRRSL